MNRTRRGSFERLFVTKCVVEAMEFYATLLLYESLFRAKSRLSKYKLMASIYFVQMDSIAKTERRKLATIALCSLLPLKQE